MRRWTVPGGEGWEFADGEDALWVLPGDPLSDVAPDDDAAAVYADLDARRTRVLRALRHHLAKSKVTVDRSGSGTWGLAREILSSSVEVGRPVTDALRRGDDDLTVLRALIAGGIARKASELRLRRCLADESEPADRPYVEPKWPDLPHAPADVLAMSGLCAALEAVPDDPADADEVKAAVTRAARRTVEGPIARALQRMASRLADVEASLELLDGSLSLEFADGHDSFRVRPKSRRLARRVRRDGPEAAGDAIADRFRRLDLRRRRAVAAMFAAMAEAGYVRGHGGFGGATPFGRRHVEFRVDLGRRLTAAVEVRGEERAIRGALPPALADRAVALLGVARDVVDLPDRYLPEDAPTGARLSAEPLTPAEVAAADAAADRAIEQWRTADDGRAWQWHLRGDFEYDPTVDDWRDAPDPWPEFEASFRRCDPHHESAGLDLLYARRREVPDLARKWLGGEWIDCYSGELRQAGDPRAIRPVALRLIAADADADALADAAGCDPRVLLPMVGSAVAGRLRDAARGAVAGDVGPGSTLDWASALTLARRAGWPEVGEAFADNPSLDAALLTPEVGLSGRREHPLVGGEKYLLAWSLVRPGDPRLARVVAEALEVDWFAEFEPLGRQIAGASGDWRRHAWSWADHALRPLAIAWRRCRRSG